MKTSNRFFLYKFYENHVPMCCTMEITRKCNFDCIHCYLKENHNLELDVERIKTIIQQIKKAGTFILNLTGGEIFFHPHFCEIYEYAIENNMIVSLLTNASLLNEHIRQTLKQAPPRKIEITLYGMTNPVFNNVTKSRLNADVVISNIRKLKADGHNLLLKMLVIKENREEFCLVREFAKQNNISFQYDFNILPAFKGVQIRKHELSVDEAINLELNDGTNKIEKWRSMFKSYDYKNNKKINCGCGRYSYVISSDLNVKKCNFMDSNEEQNLDKKPFGEIWESWKTEKDSIFPYERCKKCKFQAICDICPSISFAMSRNTDGWVWRQCELAKKRYTLIQNN